MAQNTFPHRLRVNRALFGGLTAIVILIGGIVSAIYLSHDHLQDDIIKELSKILMQLGLIGIVTLIIRHIAEEHRERNKEDRAIGAMRRSILRRITGAYRQMILARDLIAGNRSAKTYGEQMMQTIPLRVQARLADIQNDVDTPGILREGEAVKDHLRTMIHYAEQLMQEYRHVYQERLVPLQRKAEQSGDYQPVHRALQELPVLSDREQFDEFARAYREIRSALLREQLL